MDYFEWWFIRKTSVPPEYEYFSMLLPLRARTIHRLIQHSRSPLSTTTLNTFLHCGDDWRWKAMNRLPPTSVLIFILSYSHPCHALPDTYLCHWPSVRERTVHWTLGVGHWARSLTRTLTKSKFIIIIVRLSTRLLRKESRTRDSFCTAISFDRELTIPVPVTEKTLDDKNWPTSWLFIRTENTG